MCYNESGKNQMPESSEAKSYTDTKIPLKEKPQLEVVKEETPEVPKKVQRKIAKKVAACISAGMVASTGGFIALGETGNLPEQVQEWYNDTSENIRAIFGIEVINDVVVDKNVSQTPEAPFEGLKIEGLEHVFQNGRWEYIVPDDGLVAGYWNDKEGRYEHTASVLKGEWSGLFVFKLLGDIENLTSKKEWTKEDWENGEIKIPIPFMITKGGVIEEMEIFKQDRTFKPTERQTTLAVSNLPDKTALLMPFINLEHASSMLANSDSGLAGVNLIKDELWLTLYIGDIQAVNDFHDIIQLEVALGNREIKFGDQLLELNKYSVLTSPMLKAINLSFDLNKYQILLSLSKFKGSDTGGVNFTFDNLLKDEKGRFIFMIPGLIQEADSSINEK